MSSVDAALNATRKYGKYDPSPAQAEAGNYKKKHIVFQGIPISIENPKGTIRRGIDHKGKPWAAKMLQDYGYIKRTLGKDGDQVDCFVGPNRRSNRVFVVDQLHHNANKFDEHKCLLGFDSEKQAMAAYRGSYGNTYDFRHQVGAVTEMSVDAFKEWLKGGGGKKPISPEVPQYKDGGVVTKVAKATAHYRVGTQTEHCGICTMFRSPSSCTAVEGKIRWMDNCDYFEKKSSKYQEGGAVDEGESWDPDAVVPPTPTVPPRFTDPIRMMAPPEATLPEPRLPGTDVTAYHPTWRERMAQTLIGDKPPSPEHEQFVRGLLGTTGLGEQASSLADVTPLGMGLGAQESFQRGDYTGAILNLLPGMATESAVGRAALAPVARAIESELAPTAVAKPGPEAVHYWSQNLADSLIKKHGTNVDAIENSLNQLRGMTNDRTATAILAKLPEDVQHELITRDLNRSQSEWGRAGWTVPPEPAPAIPPQPAFTHPEEAKDWMRSKGYAPEDWGYSDPENYVDLANELRSQGTATGVPPPRRLMTPQPSFREILHPEDAKDWLIEHGHEPRDMGFQDPESYVIKANELKQQEMGLAPRPDQRDRLAELETEAGQARQAPSHEVKPISKDDLEQLFDTYHANQVYDLSYGDLQAIRDKLSITPDTSRFQERDPALWNALHQRFDDFDREMERRTTWFEHPLDEPLLSLTSTTEPRPGPVPAGPWQSTYDPNSYGRFTSYYNQTLGRIFPNQEDFAKHFFGGMDTSKVRASIGVDTHAFSGTPSLRFEGDLYHPNGDKVGYVDREIVPEANFAYHSYFKPVPKYRSGEVAPQMLRNQIDTYKNMGVKRVGIFAALESGPYAWAKYGWIPTEEDWDNVRNNTIRRIEDGRLKISNERGKALVMSILRDPNPRSIWKLSDITAKDDYGNEIGRVALLGDQTRDAKNITFGPNNWSGGLNLQDPLSMERFDAYYKRQIEKAAEKKRRSGP